MKKYNTYNDIVSESTLLSFNDFTYENRTSTFNITVGESYSVKAKKDKQGKFEFELTDKFGNTNVYSEKKFISMMPEAYVKFKNELHTNISKNEPELKDLDELDKKIIKEDYDNRKDSIDFLFKKINPIDTNINSLVAVDFVVPQYYNKEFVSNELFHVFMTIGFYMNNTNGNTIFKVKRYPVSSDFVLGHGENVKKSEKEYSDILEEALSETEFKKKYYGLYKLLQEAVSIYISYLNTEKENSIDEFTINIKLNDTFATDEPETETETETEIEFEDLI